MDPYVIIVEGKNDKNRLQGLLSYDIPILATYGIPSVERIERIRRETEGRQVIIFTDADSAGLRIRRILRDVFPDAIDVHTKPGYNGVEHTPVEYLQNRLRKIGLISEDEEYLDT